ncbi:hypothetical protein [Embleya sp. MST-111070]|uniref:hypothetical protein n=1 Tax=Embleya sp. MST-111070 TaxID=3398231 RepID=UPI003F73A663
MGASDDVVGSHRHDLTDAERADAQLAIATGWTGIAGAMRALARAVLTEADAITARLDAQTGDRSDDPFTVGVEEARADTMRELRALRLGLLPADATNP